MFRTITAKFPGSCKRCQAPIYVGQSIRYGGPGRTYHFAADCAQAAGAQGDAAPAQVAQVAQAGAQDAPLRFTTVAGATITAAASAQVAQASAQAAGADDWSF